MATKTATRSAPRPSTAKQVAKIEEETTYIVDTASAQIPDFMRGDAGVGSEHLGQEDMEIPRLKLIQGLSPELQAYDGLRPGMFFHTAAERIFDGPVRIVPVYMDRRYILWNPREAGGGILARADDGMHWDQERAFTVKLDKKDGGHTVTWKTAKTVQASGLANWGSSNPNDPDSPPAATLMYSIVVAFPEHPELPPAVITLQRSSIKAGRRFNTKLKTIRAPIFGLVFELRSQVDTNGSNQDFYNLDFGGSGFVKNQSLYDQYRELHEGFKAAGFAIKDLEGTQNDEMADAGDDAVSAGGRQI